MNLTEDDIEYLNANHNKNWEYLPSSECPQGVIIHNYQIPNGYNEKEVDLMLRIPGDYPGAQIDMFFICPFLERKDKILIPALGKENHFGRQWQRWSRHYGWRPGEDYLYTHVQFVYSQLKVDLGK